MSSQQNAQTGLASRRPSPIMLYAIFFVSGFVALVYQVLWLHELKLLFGSTAQAVAATLAVFFLGLAAGGAVGGSWAARSRRPLGLYARIEAGVAIAAGLCFLLAGFYRQLYSTFFGALLDAPLLDLLLKALLAVILLFPAAFCLGATLPLMGQAIVESPKRLGSRGAWLYAWNTLGGALGALVAGFYLPALWGFTTSYLFAMGLSLLLALAAWWLSGRSIGAPAEGGGAIGPKPEGIELGLAGLYALAFLSGLLALGLEVLWTRMLTQVFHNSVYSFSAILTVFLVALGLGSVVAHFLAKLKGQARWLGFLMTASGILVALSPFVFFQTTAGLGYVGSDLGWSSYVIELFRTVAVAILLPGVLVGTVFPYLFKLAEGLGKAPGLILGRLAACNTVGAITGAVLSGFVLLETLGLWKSLQLMAALYVLAAILLFDAAAVGARRRRWIVAIPMLLVVGQLAAYALGYLTFPLTRVRTDSGETLVEEWEGSQGTVAVVERGRGRNQPTTTVMRLNNHYTLGTSASLQFERGQADLPMLIHPKPESIFFLGMGTGVTAAAALQYPVRKVVITELVPEVVEASRKYFRPHVGSLFEDGRVRIAAVDGRNYLQATPERFDVIISDLFLPWAVGTSSLYSLEHFETVRSRLTPGGLFAQWLPLYQLSSREFSIVTRTMLEVFPQVTLWRGDFFASRPIVALIGQEQGARLSPQALTRIADLGASGSEPNAGQVLPFLLYVSNLTENRDLFADHPINTDDRPVIEYLAPRTHRSGEENRWLTAFNLAGFYERLRDSLPYADDPYLRELSEEQRAYVEAGYFFYQGAVRFYNAERTTAERFFNEFRARVPVAVDRLPTSLAREPADGDWN